jgi:hypothetical protein
MSDNPSEYPSWICGACGVMHGRPRRDDGVSTYHEPNKADPDDRCGWCGTQDAWLTEPRDFRYPPHPDQCSG